MSPCGLACDNSSFIFPPAQSWLHASAHFPKFVHHFSNHLLRTSESHGHWQIYDSSAAFRFEVPGFISPYRCRDSRRIRSASDTADSGSSDKCDDRNAGHERRQRLAIRGGMVRPSFERRQRMSSGNRAHSVVHEIANLRAGRTPARNRTQLGAVLWLRQGRRRRATVSADQPPRRALAKEGPTLACPIDLALEPGARRNRRRAAGRSRSSAATSDRTASASRPPVPARRRERRDVAAAHRQQRRLPGASHRADIAPSRATRRSSD